MSFSVEVRSDGVERGELSASSQVSMVASRSIERDMALGRELPGLKWSRAVLKEGRVCVGVPAAERG